MLNWLVLWLSLPTVLAVAMVNRTCEIVYRRWQISQPNNFYWCWRHDILSIFYQNALSAINGSLYRRYYLISVFSLYAIRTLWCTVTSCLWCSDKKCTNVDSALCAGWLRRSTFAASWESFLPRQDAERFESSYIFLDLVPVPIFLQITHNSITSNFYLYLESSQCWIRGSASLSFGSGSGLSRWPRSRFCFYVTKVLTFSWLRDTFLCRLPLYYLLEVSQDSNKYYMVRSGYGPRTKSPKSRSGYSLRMRSASMKAILNDLSGLQQPLSNQCFAS